MEQLQTEMSKLSEKSNENQNRDLLKLLEQQKYLESYEEKLKVWEQNLQSQASIMNARENEINARELRVIDRM